MQNRKRKIYVVTLVGSLVNLFLLSFKFFAGVKGDSGAMVADAMHSFSDFITDVIVIVFVAFASRPDDDLHPYGYGKYETIATTLVSIFLFFVGIGIFWEGASDIWKILCGTIPPAPKIIAFYAALVSVLLKGILSYWTFFVGKQENSKAVLANAWHHWSDALSSVGTGIGIGGAYFLGGKWVVLDSIAAVVVSIFILKASISLFLPAMNELTDRSLPQKEIETIKQVISQFTEVRSLHHLRTRYIGRTLAIEMHIRMSPETTLLVAHDTTKKIEHSLKESIEGRLMITIHVEPFK